MQLEQLGPHARKIHEDHKARVARIAARAYTPAPKPEPVPESRPIMRDMLIVAEEPKPLTTWQFMQMVLKEVAEKHGIEPHLITSGRRLRPIIIARFEVCYRAVLETNWSLPRIGQFMNKDHTTVMYGARQHCKINSIPYPRGISKHWLNRVKATA